ncbi:efflux RND transporter periplasmic adaptor subunit [bacterium]|nr:efflux RND transporter periplasmic adaptor subunit [bacterium]
MKKIVIILVIVGLLAGLGWYFWSAKDSNKGPKYSIRPVKRETVQSVVTATGELTAVTAVQVGAEVSGVIDKIYVEHNSTVKKGQLLAQINPDTLQTKVDQAQANLTRVQSSYDNVVANSKNTQAAVKKAQANLLSQQATVRKAESSVDNARANVANSEAGIYTAKANLAKAEAEYANNKLNYERYSQLYSQDLVARSERDDAYTTLLTSQASVNSAKASVEAALASLNGNKAQLQSAIINLEGTKADLEAARIQVEAAQDQFEASQASVRGAIAEVEQARANLNSAKVDLSKTSITSPIDGIVLSIEVSEGQTVASQFQAPDLFKLAQNLDEMQVEATVDEADIGQIKVGNKATFTVDAWTDREFEGKVVEVRKSSKTTNNVVTFPVIITTNNPDMCLMPGMTATVDIHTVQHNNVLVVPSSALRFKPDADADILDRSESNNKEENKDKDDKGNVKKIVYLLDKTTPDRLIKLKVSTGLSDGSVTEIISDELKERDMVVTGKLTADESNKIKSRGRRRPRGPF